MAADIDHTQAIYMPNLKRSSASNHSHSSSVQEKQEPVLSRRKGHVLRTLFESRVVASNHEAPTSLPRRHFSQLFLSVRGLMTVQSAWNGVG